MEKSIDLTNENSTIAPSTSLVLYEDKNPLIIVDDEKGAAEEKPKKIRHAFGIVSFVFSIFSLLAVIIMGVPTAFNCFSPILTTVTAPFTFIIPLALLIFSFLIIFVLFVLMMPAPIIGLIFATVDGNKNGQRTFLGEFGNTTSLVSLLTLLACMVISLLIYLIPLLISLIIEVAKIAGLIALIAGLIGRFF